MHRIHAASLGLVLLVSCGEAPRSEVATRLSASVDEPVADTATPENPAAPDAPSSGPPTTVTVTGDTVRNYGGFLLRPIEAGWAIRHIERNGQHEVILQRSAGRTADGHTRWRELDTIAVPEWGADDFLAHQACLVNGQLDSAMVAVFEYEEVPVLRGARGAWRVDTTTAALVPLEPSAVECENEEYGV